MDAWGPERPATLEKRVVPHMVNSTPSNIQTPLHLVIGTEIFSYLNKESATSIITTTAEWEILRSDRNPPWTTIVDISYHPSSSPTSADRYTYPTRSTISSSLWKSALTSTQTRVSVDSRYKGIFSTIYTSALTTSAVSLFLSVTSSGAADPTAIGFVPAPGVTTTCSSEGELPTVESTESGKLWGSWSTGHKVGLVLCIILGLMIVLGLFILWRKKCMTRDGKEYDEEVEVGGGGGGEGGKKGKKEIKSNKDLFGLYTLSRKRNRRMERSRKTRFTGDRNRSGPFFIAAAQTIRDTEKTTLIRSSPPESSPSITGSSNGNMGRDGKVGDSESLNQVFPRIGDGDFSNRSSRSSAENFTTKGATDVSNPAFTQLPGAQAHDYFYSIESKAWSNSDKALPVVPPLPFPRPHSLVHSFLSFETPQFPEIRVRTPTIVAEEARPDDSKHRVCTSRTHLKISSNNHPRKSRSHGRGVPANVVRRHTVHGRKFIHTALKGRSEETGGSMQSGKSSGEPAQNRGMLEGYVHEYSTLEERLRGKSPARRG